METITFSKTECGVDFLINVLNNPEPGQFFKAEYHNTNFFEIVFIRKGNGRLFLNDTIINIKNDSIIFISPFQKKKWDIEKHSLDVSLLVFQEDFLNEFFSDKLFTYRLSYFYQNQYPLILNLPKEQIRSFCNILKEVKVELKATNFDSAHIIRSLIYYLLQRLNRLYGSSYNLSYQIDASNHAYAFKRLMETHIRQKQRINEYCELLGISRITINSAVKKQFNTTATDLLKKRLLSEIKTELIYSGKNVSEIAYEFGYSDPNHLMRFFKKQTGKTPSEFINTYQNDSL
ncbi:AraC family transcriptional regulator [Chryseobacterium sp. RLHN22]|uniref:AraC family transcriptional regulator n=1 Tax=Chryseobacterium sp. RLHN22 TaxID=3437885 RepID=UPI003D9BBA7C